MIKSIIERRSIRKYSPDEVTEEEVNALLEAAMYSPSSFNSRPWHFIVVRDPDKKEKLSKATPYSGPAAKAPLVIAVCADMKLAKRWVEDCSIAAEHILLQAVDLGLGGCWIQIYESELEGRDAEEYVKEILKIPENYRVLCLLSIGRPAEKKAAHSKEEFSKEKVHYEEF